MQTRPMTWLKELLSELSLQEVFCLPGLAVKILHFAGTWAGRRMLCTNRCHQELIGPSLRTLPLGCKVVLVGGHSGRGHGTHEPLATAELFDARSGSWETMPGPSIARSHSAAASFAGHVYIIGGRDADDNSLSSVESFDFTCNLWRKMPDLVAARHSAAAVCVGGCLLVMGGFDGLAALDLVERMDCESFHPAKTWTPSQPLSFPRGKHAAVVQNRHVFLLGGMDSGYRCLMTAESIRPDSTASWVTLPQLRFARSECTASAVSGAVIVLGGVANGWTTLSNAERYQPCIGQWEVLSDMSIIRRDCASASVAGELYVMGGMSFGGRCTSKVESFLGSTWQDVAPLPNPRCGCCAAAVKL